MGFCISLNASVFLNGSIMIMYNVYNQNKKYKIIYNSYISMSFELLYIQIGSKLFYNEKIYFPHSTCGKKKQIFLPHVRKKSPWERGKTCDTLVQTETFSDSCQVLKTEVYNRNCLVTLITAFGTVLPLMSKHLFKALVRGTKVPTYRVFIEFVLKYENILVF